MFYGDTRLISPPMKVQFLGWISDTYTLQRYGWSVSADENPIYGTLRLALKHEVLKLYAISDTYNIDFMSMKFNRYDLEGMEVNFSTMVSKYTVMVQEKSINGFKPIDAEPQIINLQQKSLEDFKIFKQNIQRNEEIIVDPVTVNTLMEQIIQLQTPKQQEIRERRKRERERNNGMLENPGENTEIVCNILKLVA